MKIQNRWVLVSLLASVAMGCGSSAKKATPCPTGTVVGAMVQCMCGAMTGTATCQASKTLSDCSCTATAAGTGGSTGGSGGSAGTGGMRSSTGGAGGMGMASGGTGGGSGGSGGMSAMKDEDAGPGSSTGGSSGGGAVQPLPMDGNQLSVCTMAQGDCNRGFACYSPVGAGQGFCSKVCNMDSDCAGLAPTGTKYSCPPAGGPGGTRVCEIACMNTMDTTTCPKDMACMVSGMTGGGGPGGGGGMSTYACKYTATAGMPPGTAKEWESCMRTSECLADLTCVGGTPAFGMTAARPGHCSKSCMMTADCTNKPSGGTINPTCVQSGLGMTGGPAMVCALNCAMAMMACPTGMSCVASFGGASYCQISN
jgi:hypothetical protein